MNLPSEQADAIDAILSRMPPKGQALLASSASAGWDDVPAAVVSGPMDEFFDFAAPFPLVLFALKGASPLDWRRGTRYSRLDFRPGDVLITPRGDSNRLRAHRAVELLICPVDGRRLDDLAAREWPDGRSTFAIAEGLHRGDVDLWALGHRLAAQLLDPLPGSRAYAGALLTQIAVHLLRDYSSLAAPGEPADGRVAPRLRPVMDYIRRNLTEDVSLETLAGVAGLSPNYFLAEFRQATGQTPHRYVTELRVARACELLRDPHRPITEVSLAVGFSSQSHLTEVFRRTMKTTPAAYRRAALGLNGSAPDPGSSSAE